MVDRKPRKYWKTYESRRRHESATSSRGMRSLCKRIRKVAEATGMTPAALAGLPSGVMIPVCRARYRPSTGTIHCTSHRTRTWCGSLASAAPRQNRRCTHWPDASRTRERRSWTGCLREWQAPATGHWTCTAARLGLRCGAVLCGSCATA